MRRISISDPSFSLWGRRRLETLRKAGAGKAEIVAALEKYINSLKEDEAIAKGSDESARGTQVDVHDVQFRRIGGRDLVERGEGPVMRDESARTQPPVRLGLITTLRH